MKNHFGRVSLSHFVQNVLIETSDVWNLKYIQISPAPTEVLQKILEKVFITNKFTQCKTLRT